MDEIPKISQKFLDADNLPLLINSVLKQFNGKLNEKFNKEDVYNLPSWFFEIKKPVILIDVPSCEKKNEISTKHFLKKFYELTNDLYETKVKLITKKMRNLFGLKSKDLHPQSGS